MLGCVTKMPLLPVEKNEINDLANREKRNKLPYMILYNLI